MTPRRGSDPDSAVAARYDGRLVIVDLIREMGSATRTQLATRAGYSSSSVTSLVAGLLEDGVIEETDLVGKGRGSGSGRPARRLRYVGSGAHVAGIDFGHAHLSVAVADASGQILRTARSEIDVDIHAEEALDRAAATLRELESDLGLDGVASVVVGVPGPIDRNTGELTSPSILASWVGLRPREELVRRLGVPVHVENDAVLGAYGEGRRGAGERSDDFLYVKVSHGIGAALMLGGQPYRGATGLAGEIGHTKVPGRTELCRCGERGCIEAAVSTGAVRDQLVHTHRGVMNEVVPLTFAADPATSRLMQETGRTLGWLFSTLCNLVNPSALIIGGELGIAHPGIIDGVREALERHAQPAIMASLDVVPAELGESAELVGAVLMAAERQARVGAMSAR
ncbi:ROK family protein [Leifsonia sp. NPDC058194]|uniref:ROK family transcriptional regulator n=1 Tax=Leifsonia sp. NPDC058194 TaxID=3346374 RepID=UPI0036DEB303